MLVAPVAVRKEKPQVQPERPGLPCAMVYGLWRALPGVRALIATVAPRETSREKLDPSIGGSGPHAFARPPAASLVSRCG